MPIRGLLLLSAGTYIKFNCRYRARKVFVKRKCELLSVRRHVLAVQCVVRVCSRDRWRRTEREWEWWGNIPSARHVG
ncbi:hypothetical protein PUN28_006314 [Cardiocondyla obscurior]|uniref:Secreted protein n=1 Tax=Cardiocondyla obscurior TaxID=286306 RepID=A0AAW2G8Q0_9HYME